MTKVLFLLSAVVMVVAGFFSYQNRETFIATRLSRHKTDADIKREKANFDRMADENAGLNVKKKGVETEVGTETERLAQAKIKLRNAESDASRYQKDLEGVQGKIADYKKELEGLPVGVSMDTLPEAINKLKQEIADSEGQVTKIQEQVAGKESEVKKVQGNLDDIRGRIEARKKFYDRNSLTATIVAVNNDWGFVVIDGGENKGITVDTKLLITRGTDTIGRLNIVNVERSRTVANIDQKSLRSGLVVSPGDKVILETLYQ